jgi:hypothetical protein
MAKRLTGLVCSALVVASSALLGIGVQAASAKPVLMPTVTKEIQLQKQIWAQHTFAPAGSLQPPAPPCPENGMLPSPFSNCGVPEAPATTLPYPGNMAYYGGPVIAKPHVYVVFWGWGESGAFPANEACTPEKIVKGAASTTLACDPDGAGQYLADWVHALGGTQWAGEQTQYYETTKSGAKEYITNPRDQLAGLWADDSNSITNLPKTSGTAAAGPGNTYTDLAAEAARAVTHFHITDLANSQIVVAQPANYSDPNAEASGYCAFHDYTYPGEEGGIYNGLPRGIDYDNIPYQLSINSGGANECGENAVNSGPRGKLDGFSIVAGHEIEESNTDPGAEDVIGTGTSATEIGGWYDATDANENGDKCAWVGEGFGAPGEPAVTPIPGHINDITGNDGRQYAVQSLWSNQAAQGAGYCAGAGDDFPGG